MLQKTGRIKAQLLTVYSEKGNQIPMTSTGIVRNAIKSSAADFTSRKRNSVCMVENLTFESIDDMRKYAEEHNKVVVYWWYEMEGANNGAETDR